MAITLEAIAPQKYAGQQYVARILGLDPQSTFRLERIGHVDPPRITTAYVVTPGLYCVCDLNIKGKQLEVYKLILEFEGELLDLRVGIGKDAAKIIAKRLDLGESIEQIVELQIDNNGRPKYRIRKKTGIEAAGDTEATAAQES